MCFVMWVRLLLICPGVFGYGKDSLLDVLTMSFCCVCFCGFSLCSSNVVRLGNIAEEVEFQFTLSGGDEMAVDGVEPVFHLEWSKLPQPLATRYQRNPKKLYIRQCYRDLYDQSIAVMKKFQSEGVTLFTGTPGIGKSMFLLYYIFRLIADQGTEALRFAFQCESTWYYLFERLSVGANFTQTVKVCRGDNPPKCLLLADLTSVSEPAYGATWTCIFSSPNEGRYKEIMKNSTHIKYIMPTWTEQELSCIEANSSKLRELYEWYGGVPRHVFPSQKVNDAFDDVRNALTVKGPEVCGQIFTGGFGGKDDSQSYILVHINPPMVDGVYIFCGQPVYCFASHNVFLRLSAMYEGKKLAEAVNIFNVGDPCGTFGPSTAGVMFEKLCLWLAPFAGKILEAQSLPLTANQQASSFVVPLESRVLNNNHPPSGSLEPNCLYIPRFSNLESGDAFYVIPHGNDGKFQLVVLQITVAESHPVKVNGLNTIVSAYQEEIVANIDQKVLLFVTYLNGQFRAVQSLTTQQGGAMADASIPVNVREFQQYVCNYRLSAYTESIR